MSKATKKRFVHRQMETEFMLPTEKQYIAKVIGSKGNNLHEVLSEHGGQFLASMPTKFRNTVWIKRDQFVIVEDIEEGDKVKGEIANVLDSESILYIDELGRWPESFKEDSEKLKRSNKRNQKSDGDLIDADMLPPSERNPDNKLRMGNMQASLMLQKEEISEIAEETGFSKNQIVRLYSRFLSLDKQGRGYLDREDLLRIPELAINPLGDRIVDAFFRGQGDGERMNFRQFINVLAHFRPINKRKPNSVNSRESKLRFAFSMYDLNKNDYITREEFKYILNMMVGSNITEDQLDHIAERTITEADLDKDGKISFEEFCKAMERTDIDQKMSIRFLN